MRTATYEAFDVPGGAKVVERELSARDTPEAITHYVQCLTRRGETSSRLFESAWQSLGNKLFQELRAKGLWTSPPSYLGVYGFDSWSAPGRADLHPGGALDELLQDCFTFVVIERLSHLAARLKVHDTIEGDVYLYVRNFVHGRQKDHDPLGFRLYELLRSAVQEALSHGELVLQFGDPGIRNDTILAFCRRSATTPGEDLGELVRGWAQGAVADLFSAGPGSRARAVRRLRQSLLRLRAQGIDAFSFRSAIDVLKRDVRSQLAALYEVGQGDVVVEIEDDGSRSLVKTLQPETWVEDIDSYRKLVACVSELVARHPTQGPIRTYLDSLWGLLRRFAASVEERLPAHRKISHLLSIPRARIPGLLELLGGLVDHCRGRRSGPRPLGPSGMSTTRGNDND